MPHDGKYYVAVFDYSRSGSYTLAVEIPNRAGFNTLLIIGIVAVVAIAVVVVFITMRRRKAVPSAPSMYAPSYTPPSTPSSGTFRQNCGAPLSPGVAFCQNCGRAKLTLKSSFLKITSKLDAGLFMKDRALIS